MKIQVLTVCLSLTMFFTQANAQHGQHAAKTTQTQAIKEHQVDPEFKKQVGAVYEAHLKMKDAFVATDLNKVKTAIKPVKEALAKVDMKLVKDQAHTDWMAYQSQMSNSLKKMEETTNIEDQRKFFANFNDGLYKSLKAFGTSGTPAYYQHCPMAFGNTGGSWLSDSKEIRNPYFGDKMLKCGSVKETIN